eukprot:TRINITY_DN774621_c0_g1_i1.p1 TRINITY_DN774621_c0_g1~~TRINITY_DN774621_c0_g1_i1.p1  ORF type:complete len:204 (+),score=49.70 TRINITY_DN774621_c0_g1_i1:81-692(+)
MSSKKSLLKIVLLGDCAVGKTSLIDRYVKNSFEVSYKVTIGVDFSPKEVKIDDRSVSLQIWDTVGQERYKSLTKSFYHGTDACILVYDVTKGRTFESVLKWKQEFLRKSGISEKSGFPFVVLGNKSDMEGGVVKANRAQHFCAENGEMTHFQVSAKSGVNVDEAFLSAVRKALERDETAQIDLPDAAELSWEATPSSSGKCGC